MLRAPSPALSVLLLAALLPPGISVLVVSAVLISLGTLTGLLLSQGLTPPPALLPPLALAAIQSSLGLALPTALLLGCLSGLRRLRDEGAWLALQSFGCSGRQIGLRLLLLLLPALLLQLALQHRIEPAARERLRALRVAAALHIEPVGGQTLHVGPWSIAVEGGLLRFAGRSGGADLFGEARSWALLPARDGVMMQLGDGRIWSADPPSAMRFGTLRLPVPLPGLTQKSHASERGTADLLEKLRASPLPAERLSYEWWLLHKRTLLPICQLLLCLAAPPFALGPRPLWPTGLAMILSLWTLTRLADRNINALGQPVAAALLVSGCALWLLGWWRWPAR